MKIFKYLAIALIVMTMVACNDDEPSNTFTREFNMIYPQHAPGHKQISKIEQEDTKGVRGTKQSGASGVQSHSPAKRGETGRLGRG